jgi:hypothetical protein
MGGPLVLTCAGIKASDIDRVLGRYGIVASWVGPGALITGSFWGEPEAGIVGRQVYIRADTPVHSLLHEISHIVCMTPDRREVLQRNAGGDDLEESAVCYLQVLLADYLPGVGRQRLMQDMDAWGYSFRLGATRRWFDEDAGDALAFLLREGLVTAAGKPQFRLRGC